MPITARYGHTNIVAADWRALADFYEQVLGCVPVTPDRDFQGAAIEAATGLPGAHLRGRHLRLPGGGPDGPTLEIFTYAHAEARPATAPNRPGFGHMAFIVDDIAAGRAAVLAAGGGAVGETVRLTLADGTSVTMCYLTDPEGNIVELQQW
jgi:catechol 2,3-dioxygenase-like lactoylglutathione lyase family enzyme